MVAGDGGGREGGTTMPDRDAKPPCAAAVVGTCHFSFVQAAASVGQGRPQASRGPWVSGHAAQSRSHIRRRQRPQRHRSVILALRSLRPAPPLRPRLAAPRPAMLCPASSLCSEPLEAGTAGSSRAAVAACRDVAVPGSLCAPPRAGREAGCALPSPHRGLCSSGSAPMGRGGPSSPTFCPPCCF